MLHSKTNIDRVYFTGADPNSQFGDTESVGNRLEKYLRTWILLSDQIIMSGSHVLESEAIFNILHKNPELLSKKIIIPYMREGIADYHEYGKILEEEKKKYLVDNYSLEYKSNFLNNNISEYIYFTASDARTIFKNKLLDDIENDKSFLRERLNINDLNLVDKIINNISAKKIISRDYVNYVTGDFSSYQKRVMEEYINYIYYIIGASVLKATPVLRKNEFDFGYNLINIKKATSTSHNIENIEPDLLIGLLDMYGLIGNIIEELSIKELVDLRNSTEGEQFRKKWRLLVSSSKKNDVVGNSYKETLDFMQILKQEYKKEFIKYEKYSS